MDAKIIKYKLKKNKLEEKIIDMLNLKKESYENQIINSNDNHIITENIENFFFNLISNKSTQSGQSTQSDQSSQLVIIVFGSYSVGKTTFISHLENYIKMLEMNLINKNIKLDLIQKIIFTSNNADLNLDLSSKITIIECDINDVNQINSLISNSNIININIIPKSARTLKNKIINKIFKDTCNELDLFLKFTKDIIDEKETNNIINKINLLKTKNQILDDDFIFLDKTVGLYYSNIIELSNNINIPSNKYYL